MKLLFVNTITSDFLTSKGGLDIGKNIEKILQNNPFENVEVSFDRVTNVSPSFVNGAFLYLIDNYGADYFRSHVKVINATSEVAKTIGDSVRIYLDRQKDFFETLKINKLYFASDGSETGRKLTNELNRISSEKGFENSFIHYTGIISDQTKSTIENSDALIGVLTENQHEVFFSRQVEIAYKANKPCILLLHKNLDFRLPTVLHDKIQVVYFDETDYLEKLKLLNKILTDRKRDILPFAKHNNIPVPNDSNTSTESALILIAITLLAFLFFDKRK